MLAFLCKKFAKCSIFLYCLFIQYLGVIMTSGVKAVDNLIEKYGFLTKEGKNPFQTVMTLFGQDDRLTSMKMPYCFFRILSDAKLSEKFSMHHLYLPHRKARLASFLVNSAGDICEQVYYVRDAKGVKVCKKVQQMLASRIQNRDLFAA